MDVMLGKVENRVLQESRAEVLEGPNKDTTPTT